MPPAAAASRSKEFTNSVFCVLEYIFRDVYMYVFVVCIYVLYIYSFWLLYYKKQNCFNQILFELPLSLAKYIFVNDNAL